MSTDHHPATDAGDLPVRYGLSVLSADDFYLFNQGSHFQLYEKLGAHIVSDGETPGVHFAVWAPNARQVSVIGDFNGWDRSSHRLQPLESSGIWEGFIPGSGAGRFTSTLSNRTTTAIRSKRPIRFGLYYELAPKTASIVWDLDYAWGDEAWMTARRDRPADRSPVSIYEVHLGSWRRVPEDGDRFLTYVEMADRSPSMCWPWGSPMWSFCR